MGTKDVSRVGDQIAVLGDVNNDGYEDLLHMVEAFVAVTQEVQLWILSGKDGKTLRVVRSARDRRFGNPTAVGDMDGDGVPDYALRSADSPVRRPYTLAHVRCGTAGLVAGSAGQLKEAVEA